MRSASLFVVLGLVFVLAVSSFSPVAGDDGGEITIVKVTTNGDNTTVFHFTVSDEGGVVGHFDLRNNQAETSPGVVEPGVYIILEEVPPGWELRVDCGGLTGSTFEYVPSGVIITFVEGDNVGCKFINSPAPAVGGVVAPANTLALVAPWLAVIGLVGCISTVAVVVKKRR